jgi:hypothetical protein
MQLTEREKRASELPREEKEALERWVDSGGVSLAHKTAAQFYELYLQGASCSEIAKLNPGFDLGLIVKAKVDHDWEQKRQLYLDELSESVKTAVQKASLETIQFASDALSVFHKMAGTKFRKYLQTGDEAELGPFANMSMKSYKDFVELLMKLTGRDSDSKQLIVGEVVHTHTVRSDEKTVEGEAKVVSAAEKLSKMVHKK